MEYPWLLIHAAVLNIAAFLLFGLDKWKAVRGRWRIPESTLLLCAAAGGSIGALLGMKLFHHKVRKMKFYLGIPLMLFLQAVLCVFLFEMRIL